MWTQTWFSVKISLSLMLPNNKPPQIYLEMFLRTSAWSLSVHPAGANHGQVYIDSVTHWIHVNIMVSLYTQSIMGAVVKTSQTHRCVAVVISMDIQAVPTSSALFVLGHTLWVRTVPQQPISSSRLGDRWRAWVRRGGGERWGGCVCWRRRMFR